MGDEHTMRLIAFLFVYLAVSLSTAQISTEETVVPEDLALIQDEMAQPDTVPERITRGLHSIRWNGSSAPDIEMAEATEWQYGWECEEGKDDWEPCDEYGKSKEGWECEVRKGVWEPCKPKKKKHMPKTKKNKKKTHEFGTNPTFYKHCNYGGYAIGLKTSSPWVIKDGLKNDDLSSLKVPKGYTATIYEHWKYGGKKKTFAPGSYTCLTKYRMKGRTTWNDQISSIKIEKVGPKKKAPKKKAPKKMAPKKKAKKFAGWNRFKKMKKTHRKGWGKLKNWGKKFAKKVKGGWSKFKKKVKKATKAKSKGWKTKRWGSIKKSIRKKMKSIFKKMKGKGRSAWARLKSKLKKLKAKGKAHKKAGWNRFKKMKKTHRKGWGKLKNWGKKFAKKVKGGWSKFK